MKTPASADYCAKEFGDMDASHDDFINFEEYRYYVSRATLDAFQEIDTSKDHRIDFFEWVEYQQKQFPFESKGEFRYKGRSGIWVLDRYGRRNISRSEHLFRHRYGVCDHHRHDCRHGIRHGPWHRYHFSLWHCF